MAAKDGKHAWKAEGVNPKTGREVTLKGGEAKHRGKWGTQNDSTKGYINDLNWRLGSRIGKTVNIPNNRF